MGVVTDSALGVPVNGAIVSLRQGFTTIRSDTTDANGAYTLDSVVTGDYTVRVQCANYVTKSVAVTTRGTADQTVDVAIAPVPTAVVVKRLAGRPAFDVFAKGLLRLSNFSENGVVDVFGVDGKLVWRRTFGGGTTLVSFPATSGSYLVSMKQKNAVYRKRIVLP